MEAEDMNGWRECQNCSNLVAPLSESITGFGEVYSDTNPLCEECQEAGVEIKKGYNELPF